MWKIFWKIFGMRTKNYETRIEKCEEVREMTMKNQKDLEKVRKNWEDEEMVDKRMKVEDETHDKVKSYDDDYDKDHEDNEDEFCVKTKENLGNTHLKKW